MAYTGITTRNGRCAICKTGFPSGTLVYFDATKRQGSHLAHKKCWDDLRESRRAANAPVVKPVKPQILSEEPLDPPF